MKLSEKKLEIPLKQPFLAAQEMSKTQNWCHLLGVFRMESYRSVVSLSKEVGLARNMLGGIFRVRLAEAIHKQQYCGRVDALAKRNI